MCWCYVLMLPLGWNIGPLGSVGQGLFADPMWIVKLTQGFGNVFKCKHYLKATNNRNESPSYLASKTFIK